MLKNKIKKRQFNCNYGTSSVSLSYRMFFSLSAISVWSIRINIFYWLHKTQSTLGLFCWHEGIYPLHPSGLVWREAVRDKSGLWQCLMHSPLPLWVYNIRIKFYLTHPLLRQNFFNYFFLIIFNFNCSLHLLIWIPLWNSNYFIY